MYPKQILMAVLLAIFSISSLANASRADGHAPIGVMGDHIHKKGEWMFSYRAMNMTMDGNRDGSTGLSAQGIVTSVPNRFFGAPMQPPTLRIVPEKMDMEMHMLGMMYAPSDSVTLMLMGQYIRKDMLHTTFVGGMGTNQLGQFTTKTSGVGDTSVSALIRWRDDLHVTAGLSLPTGNIEETGQILTPMNARPTVRLPYPMQLGSGSFDPIVGLTWQRQHGAFGFGAQWRSVLRVHDNDEEYRLGDEHRFSVWGSVSNGDALSLSLRLEQFNRGNIRERDTRIMGPVQTADPDRQASSTLSARIGLNYLLPGHKHRVAVEWGVPLQQHVDGPQLEVDSTVTIGWQYAP